MSKKQSISRPQTKNEEPAIRAARIARVGAIIAALITATGGGLWYWLSKASQPTEKTKFLVRVIGDTGNYVKGADVTVEGEGFSAVDSTDDQGAVTFLLDYPKKQIRIRVNAIGYERRDLKSTPADVAGVQEVRLTVANNLKKEPAIFPTPVPRNSKGTILTPPERTSDEAFRMWGKVLDKNSETNAPIKDVKVSVVGNTKESAITGANGEFSIVSRSENGKLLQLRAEKDGYTSSEGWCRVGSQCATIWLAHK